MTTLLALSEAYPLIRRSTGEGFAPCFVLAKTKNNVQEPIQDILVDLIVRTEGAMQIPKAIQAFVSLINMYSRVLKSFIRTSIFI